MSQERTCVHFFALYPLRAAVSPALETTYLLLLGNWLFLSQYKMGQQSQIKNTTTEVLLLDGVLLVFNIAASCVCIIYEKKVFTSIMLSFSYVCVYILLMR